MDIFSLRVNDKYLIYAPLHQFSALVNKQAFQIIRRGLLNKNFSGGELAPIIEKLKLKREAPRISNMGGLDPIFLGLIPTRGCNMNCQYCDFSAPKQSSPIMEFSTARQAINAYFLMQKSAGRNHAEVHFFGGEPFFADSLVHFAVEYAKLRAAELDLDVRFEVTTNGVFNTENCQWVADNFDAVVLSLDGSKDIQNHQRPSINKKSVFDRITANTKLISSGPSELILRACITNQSVSKMPEIAHWFGQEFQPSIVCFETLVPSDLSQKAGLDIPNPWEFAENYFHAMKILESYGIETKFSTADLDTCQLSFCPVGKDALILSPDGSIGSCYLLEERWQDQGLDFRFGKLVDGHFEISDEVLQNIRQTNVEQKSLCKNCFCRYHCAGGCHVNHNTQKPAGHFDTQCIQTRLITIALLLKQLGQEDLATSWLNNHSTLEASDWSTSDRLKNQTILQ